VVSPDLFPSSSISSAMKTPDAQSPGPPGNTEVDPDAPEPAAEGDIQMEYSSE
jgi:hypothetical protein